MVDFILTDSPESVKQLPYALLRGQRVIGRNILSILSRHCRHRILNGSHRFLTPTERRPKQEIIAEPRRDETIRFWRFRLDYKHPGIIIDLDQIERILDDVPKPWPHWLDPTRLWSQGSIVCQKWTRDGLRPPHVPKEIEAAALSARRLPLIKVLRHGATNCHHVDISACYPTAHAVLGLQDLMTATEIEWAFLRGVDLSGWENDPISLRGFAYVNGQWHTLPDLAAEGARRVDAYILRAANRQRLPAEYANDNFCLSLRDQLGKVASNAAAYGIPLCQESNYRCLPVGVLCEAMGRLLVTDLMRRVERAGGTVCQILTDAVTYSGPTPDQLEPSPHYRWKHLASGDLIAPTEGRYCLHEGTTTTWHRDHGIADLHGLSAKEFWQAAIADEMPAEWFERPAVQSHVVEAPGDLLNIRRHLPAIKLLDRVYRAFPVGGGEVFAGKEYGPWFDSDSKVFREPLISLGEYCSDRLESA